jgi:hypothetical protein
MTVATTTYRFRYNLLRHLPGLGLLLAAVAMVLLALGPIGWRAGWWHFRVGFFYLMPWASYFGIAAVLVSVLALVLGRAVIGRRGVAIGIVACIAGGVAAYTPIHYYAMRGRYPPIDDITTDTANPPAFAHGMDNRRRGSGHRQDRGERQEPVVWLHRRHRDPHRRVRCRQQDRHAFLVAARTGRFRRKCRPHPRLSGRVASVCRRAELAETAEPRSITQSPRKSGSIVS